MFAPLTSVQVDALRTLAAGWSPFAFAGGADECIH